MTRIILSTDLSWSRSSPTRIRLGGLANCQLTRVWYGKSRTEISLLFRRRRLLPRGRSSSSPSTMMASSSVGLAEIFLFSEDICCLELFKETEGGCLTKEDKGNDPGGGRLQTGRSPENPRGH